MKLMNKLTMALLVEYHLNMSSDTILADVYWLIWMKIQGILLLLFLKDWKKIYETQNITSQY